MKKITRRLLIAVLALAMIPASSAFAWSSYQGDDATHNGRINDAAVPTASASVTVKSLPHNGSGWSGVDSAPVMYNTTYTDANNVTSTKTLSYVVYNAYKDGAKLACYDSKAGTNLWSIQLNNSSTFQLSTPYLDEANNCIYAAAEGNIYKITGVNTANPSKTEIFTGANGQINTPVNKYGNYLYFGSWVGNGTIGGSADPGSYYQIDLNSSTYAYKSVMSQYHGFYWAGAIKTTIRNKNYIVFGGDNGYLYYRAENDFSGTGSYYKIPNAGNIRSSISADGSYLYFTCQNGNLWRLRTSTLLKAKPTLTNVALGGTSSVTSSSTPAISANGYIYAGYYSGFTKGGVKAVAASDFTTAKDVSTAGPVQASPIVYSEGTMDYVYFTTNASAGAGYCYSYDGTDGTEKWNTVNVKNSDNTSPNTYTLQGMAACNGCLTFGNDYDYFFIAQ